MRKQDSKLKAAEASVRRVYMGRIFTRNDLAWYAKPLTHEKEFRNRVRKNYGKTRLSPQVTIEASTNCNVVPGSTTPHFINVRYMSPLDVVHGLAHFITPPEAEFHGPEFARNYLALSKALGADVQRVLRDTFKAYGVKYRTWSPEAKERARQRAAEKGTPFTRAKLTHKEQQQEIIAMMQDLAKPKEV